MAKQDDHEYGKARIGTKKFLLTRREADSNALFAVLAFSAEAELDRVLEHMTKGGASGYVKVRVGTRFWLMREALGTKTLTGIAISDNGDELDAVLTFMTAEQRKAA